MKSYTKKISKSEVNQTNIASTPTGNYVLTPKTTVRPGVLSKFVPQRISQRVNSSVAIKETSKLHLRSLLGVANNNVPYKEVLLVNSLQGIFEIHFKYMELSTSGLRRINQFDPLETLHLNFKFFTYEKTSIALSYPSDNYIEIETSVLYIINLNRSFINSLSTKATVLELYIQDANKNSYLASADLNLSEVLQSPSTDILAKLVFCDSHKALLLSDTGISINFGTLVLWFRLGCNEVILNKLVSISTNYESFTNLMDKKNQQVKSSTQTIKKSVVGHICFIDAKTQRSEPELLNDCEVTSESFLKPTESETENFQEALDLVLTRNRALRTTQSEISFQLRDRARWLHEESSWKRTLQEHAIFRGQDPENVQWRQWRTESTTNIKMQKYGSQTEIYGLNVVIEIKYIKLSRNSDAMLSDKYHSFYVEYAFLTHDGVEMECPFSVPKAQDGKKMYFNFKKSFCIDPKTNMNDCRKLADSVRKNSDIVVSVVGEPGTNVVGIPCCKEVCIGKISFLDIVEQTTNKITCVLALHQCNNECRQIGYTKIHIDGVLAMRRIALKLLAPPSYILD